MSRLKKKFKRANPFVRCSYFLNIILYIVVFALFARSVIRLSSIETLIRYLGLVLLLIIFILYIYNALIKILEKKYKKYWIMSILLFLIIALLGAGTYFINFVYGTVSSFTEEDTVTYTSYLVALNNTDKNSVNNIGMITDEDDIEGYILAKEILKKNKLKQDIIDYDDYLEMLYDLYDGKVDAVFVSSNYVSLFGSDEKLTNISQETKVLYKYSKKMNNEDASLGSNKTLDKPFTVLVLGVDSEVNGLNANAAFNGDTLILATFNPDTLSATLFSIPRDSYVPIACRNGANSKINSSAAYGTSCVIDTIESLTDIDIDYYVKINFKGVVDLVEAVGGVTVDVQEPDFRFNFGVDCGEHMVCEQNSDRDWGKNTVYIPAGVHKLNGEQALAYSRCRHLYLSSDLARNQHQQDVISALGQEMIKIDSYAEFKGIIDAISKNISTNMSTNQILSSYNILKKMLKNGLKKNDFINIQRTYLETYSLPVYVGNTYTSALGYYEGSLEDIVKTMKINLDLEKASEVKSFSFSINEEYSGYIAGKGITSGGTSNTTLENFVGKSKAAAESYCSSKSISCNYVYVDENSDYYNASIGSDLIASQSPHAGTLMKNVSSVNFYINGATSSSSDEVVDAE